MNYPRFFAEIQPDGFVLSLRITMTDEETDALLQFVPGLMEIDDAQAETIRNMTGRRWRYEGGVFVEYPDAHNKEVKWGTIKIARDAAEHAGFTWDGSVFDSDQISQSRIQGAAQLASIAQMAGQPFTIDWTLADNTVRTLSAADMISVGQALALHINATHERGRQLRAQIEVAQTGPELDAIQW